MKKLVKIFILLFINNTYSQQEKIDFWNNDFCEWTTDSLKNQDPELKQISLDEMGLCSNGYLIDTRFENGIGYQSKKYPGVIFQKLNSTDNKITKVHLTKEFKGFLPDGNYVDLKSLKVKDVLKQFDSLQPLNARSCSNYYTISKYEEFYFYVYINEEMPKFPIDEKYYAEQLIEGIDIVCYIPNRINKTKGEPIYVIDGKEVSKETVYELEPIKIKSIKVLNGVSAKRKYGENGVVEISLDK